MKMSKAGILALAALLGFAAATVQAGDANNGYDKQKVVYHVNHIEDAGAALRNVKNHINAVGDENIDLVVVTHSSGALALVDGAMGKKDKDGKVYNFEDSIAALANRGVKFMICSNTIRGLKIDKNDINQYAEIVPSGVAHVAYLQQKGYVYVKP